MLRLLKKQTEALDAEIAARAKQDDVARRLMTVPGIGPLIATAIEALAPPPETFRSGRDFAAWIGLTPVQKSTGGKERLGLGEAGSGKPGAWGERSERVPVMWT